MMLNKIYIKALYPLSILIFILIMSFTIYSCKDDVVNNVYLNLTQTSRYDDTGELNNENNILKIRVKNPYTNEEIQGASVKMTFEDGYTLSGVTDSRGIIATNKSLFPGKSFDILICYNAGGEEYTCRQRFCYQDESKTIQVIYIARGHCDSNN